MEFPDDLKYTKEHEWVRYDESSGIAEVGITEFAQSELGDLVFVELPEEGQDLNQGESFCVVESTKAASDVYCPVSGTVSKVNSSLSDTPDLINSDPYGDGWLIKLESALAEDLEKLMDAEEYKEFLGDKV